MDKIELYKSPVVFNAKDHTYFLGEKQLQGITGLLSRQLFPDKYKGVSEDVLAKAADRGHYVHEIIEMCDTLGVENEHPMYQAYKRIKDENGLISLSNEYLVSDEQNFATCIDIVFRDFSLCDIKTTSKLDAEWLSWQLSINAYLFELKNPYKVSRLCSIWLPDERYGTPRLIEVPRIPDEDVVALLEADAAGMQYQGNRHSGLLEADQSTLPIPHALLSQVKQIIKAEKEAKAVKDEFSKRMTELMENYGVKKWISPDEGLQITYVAPSKTKKLDSKRLKAEHPEIYDSYLSESEVKPSIRITLND